jgi:hypothetical protein
MGRKLIRRVSVEKDVGNKSAKGHITIIIAQHFLLYTSGYVVASTAYLIYNGTFTKDLLPIAVILEFSVYLNDVWFLCSTTDHYRVVYHSSVSAFAT